MFKTNVLRNFNNIFKSNIFNPMSSAKTSLYSNIIKFNFFTKFRTTENCLIKYQKFEIRSLKSKRKSKSPDPGYKMKTKNALRKRMRIVIYYNSRSEVCLIEVLNSGVQEEFIR